MRQVNIILWAVAAGLVVAGCSTAPKSRVEEGKITDTMEQQVIGKHYLEALGIGAPNPDSTSMAQKKATSRNAAIVQAQYELLTVIKGTRLAGGITVEKAIETDSRMQTSLDEVIKGAVPVKSEWDKEGGCVVTIRISKKRLETMMGVQFE